MSGVAGEGAAGGGSGQAQALKDAGTGFNSLRPGFTCWREFGVRGCRQSRLEAVDSCRADLIARVRTHELGGGTRLHFTTE